MLKSETLPTHSLTYSLTRVKSRDASASKNERDCLACGRKFFTEFMLNNHIAKSHTNVKCDICDKTVTKKGLSKHI